MACPECNNRLALVDTFLPDRFLSHSIRTDLDGSAFDGHQPDGPSPVKKRHSLD